jgi:cobalt-zinc-cadmium efflux system protein
MTRERRLRLALGLNLVIVAVQVVAGLVANSLSLLADAGHNLTDVAAVVVSLMAVRMAGAPPSPHPLVRWHPPTILAAGRRGPARGHGRHHLRGDRAAGTNQSRSW